MGHCAPVAKLTLKHTKHCGTGTIVKAGLEFIFARERIKIIIAPRPSYTAQLELKCRPVTGAGLC